MNKSLKILSLLLSVCLIITATGFVKAESINEATQTPIQTDSDNSFILPDIIEPKEALENKYVDRVKSQENDLNTFVFLNEDGTNTMRIFNHPVKYVAKDGTVQDISLDIVKKRGGGYVTDKHEIITTFENSLSDGISLSYNDIEIKLVPHTDGEKSSVAILESNSKNVVYKVDSTTSFSYNLTYAGFKEDIVVKEYTGKTEYTFSLFTNGLNIIEKSGSYYLVDSEGNVKATIGDIIVFTADERNNTMGSMTGKTIRAGQEYDLTIHLDGDYLADKKTLYPIRIDPTVEINYESSGSGAIQDVTINSNSGSDGASGSLSVGLRQTYGKSRILMKFPALSLSSLGHNVRITNATVEMRDLMCEATELTVYCHVFSGNTWQESTANWSTVNGDACSSLLSSNAISYANGLQQSIPHRYVFDITSAVEGWRIGNCIANKGIVFKAAQSVEQGSAYNYKTIASYNRATNKPSFSMTYSNEFDTVLEDIHYINNRGCGDYLTGDSSVTASSGLLSDLGNQIKWEIRRVNGGYVIRPASDMTKYLAVPSNSTSSSVVLETVSNSVIPLRCIWNISFASTGGCLVRSAYNSKYLYTYGSSVYTASSTGSSGTSTYDSRVWRILSQSDMEGCELSDKTKFFDIKLMLGYSNPLLYHKESENAIWSTLEDFTYSGYDASIISVSANGIVSPIATGKTTVTCKHKVTEHIFYAEVTIFSSLNNMGTLSCWYDNESYFIGHWETTPKVYIKNLNNEASFPLTNNCTLACNEWNDALGINITPTLQESSAKIKVSGGTPEQFSELGYDIESEYLGKTIWHYNYTGHYFYNGSVRLNARMNSAIIYLKYIPSKTDAENKNVCVHEFGHAVGFFGHSGIPSSVMYRSVQDEYNLQYPEISHMQQVYN